MLQVLYLKSVLIQYFNLNSFEDHKCVHVKSNLWIFYNLFCEILFSKKLMMTVVVINLGFSFFCVCKDKRGEQ